MVSIVGLWEVGRSNWLDNTIGSGVTVGVGFGAMGKCAWIIKQKQRQNNCIKCHTNLTK